MAAHGTDVHFRPFFILLFAIAILHVVSSIDIVPENFALQLKRVDIFADLRANASVPASGSPFPAERGALRPVAPDGARNRELPEGKPEAVEIDDFGVQGGSLDQFFEALRETEKTGRKVRIAYFGDSLIEGDLITQDVRRALQERFGGRGVGFVPITSVSSASRRTIRHAFSDNWGSISVLKSSDPLNKPGMSGFLFIPKSNAAFKDISAEEPFKKLEHSWVKYGTDGSGYSNPAFDAVDLLYENPGSPSVIQYGTESLNGEKVVLEQTQGLSRVSLDKARTQKHIKLMFFPADLLKIYGVSFEADKGVYVDNFSLRGSSGTNLGSISPRMFSDFNKLRDYRLIVLHYGPNIANPTMTDFTWYRKKMVNVVKRLKECLPGASIIVVSVNDICTGREDGMCTAPCVPHLVDAQRKLAEETGVGFWNLYEAMGGRNSMARWVRSARPLANPDCTHLNNTGAKAVGIMLTRALMAEYDRFKQGADPK